MQTTEPIAKESNGSPVHAVIVIGRQFGSGGARIGKLVARALGWAYYDKELLSEAAERLGYAREVIAAHDERKPSPFRSLLQGAYGIADNFHDTTICGEQLYGAQSKVIRELCEEGPCVIVGRTADYVLRSYPGLVSVFLHSPLEKRAKAIVGRGDASGEPEATEMARRMDRNRERYYNYYTGGNNWGRASNYDLSIDASAISDNEVAQIIISFATKKNTRQR